MGPEVVNARVGCSIACPWVLHACTRGVQVPFQFASPRCRETTGNIGGADFGTTDGSLCNPSVPGASLPHYRCLDGAPPDPRGVPSPGSML